MKGDFDTSKCMIDIARCKPGQRMVEAFPEVSQYPEFINTSDEYIKIAILSTDLDSPFLKIKDRELQLQSMYGFLEIGLKTTKRKEEFESILGYKHEAVTDCCYRYLQMQHNTDLNSWWTNYQIYYELQREIIKPREANTDLSKYLNAKVSWQREADKIAADIKNKEAVLFKDSKLARAIANAQVKKKIVTLPEKLAMESSIE